MANEGMGVSLEGNVYFEYLDKNWQPTGEVYGPINTQKIIFNPGSTELLERKSYMKETYGSALDSMVNKTGSATLKMTIDDGDVEMLKIPMQGDTIDGSVAAATGVTKTVNLKAGEGARFGQNNATNATLVEDVTAPLSPVTLVLGTDYTVQDSIITMLTGATKRPIKITFDQAASSATTIQAGKVVARNAAISVKGRNRVNGEEVLLDVYRGKIFAANDIEILGDNFLRFEMNVSCLIDPATKTPFTYTRIK